eukprot:1181280-Prorocentrum_minimum.AAC.2
MPVILQELCAHAESNRLPPSAGGHSKRPRGREQRGLLGMIFVTPTPICVTPRVVLQQYGDLTT